MRTVPTSLTSGAGQAKTNQPIERTELTRRQALRFLGGATLGGVSLLALNRNTTFAQEAGTPVAAATPQVGPRDDGSMLWRVQVSHMNMEEHYEFHSFFPNEITVNEGDAIWFDFGMGGFHTVSFFSGGELPEFVLQDPGTPEADGLPKLYLNPEVMFPVGGESYDGTGYLNSGIDVFRDPSQPFVLTLTSEGTYEYLCITHAAVMKATVVVQAAGTEPVHTQAEYDQIVQDEMAAFEALVAPEMELYSEATSTENADGTTTWEATVGAGGETPLRIQQILPNELTVKVGDTVRWVNRSPGEPHTISFIGEGEEVPEDLIVEPSAEGPPAFLQSKLTLLPQGGNVWSGTGWVHSGFMGWPVPGGMSPPEYELRFDTPGEYIYFCLLHGDAEGNRMAARITVTE